MSQFPRLQSFEDDGELPEPADESTFVQCKLNWDEIETNGDVLRLHRDLIRLRRDDPVFSRQDRHAIEGSVIGPEALLLRWFDDGGDDRLLTLDLGRDIEWYPLAEPLLAPPPGRQWMLLWSSEEPCYGGLGTRAFDWKRWHVAGHAALVFRAEPI
jgi:maltooligosyltrehalose trehalohydrolase